MVMNCPFYNVRSAAQRQKQPSTVSECRWKNSDYSLSRMFIVAVLIILRDSMVSYDVALGADDVTSLTLRASNLNKGVSTVKEAQPKTSTIPTGGLVFIII